ncbi:MAG: tRNA lysidine(34) synthetase TilS [Tissierellales bacterium]|jgi:tRNA(Ile)-lysidine synthase|nr:tRNA lysidine(34) synthetase TilS [Tissierellales bacterium]
MRTKLKQLILSEKLIIAGDKLLLGVSGGVDSMVLLDLMIQIRADMSIELGVAHLNHGLRGEAADKDCELVRRVSIENEIPFYEEKVDMMEYSRTHKLTPEEAGRNLRRNFFRRISEKYDYKKIVLAHNQNDQAETLIMRIFRGTGIDGLIGIKKINGMWIRPMLMISRTEIERYALEYGIKYRTDHTNLETIYERNKIRLDLLPMIQKQYNPKIIESLVRLSKSAEADVSYIEGVVDGIASEMFEIDEKYLEFSIEKFNKIDNRLKNRVLRRGLRLLKQSLEGIEENNIILLKAFIENSVSGRFHDIKDGLKAHSYNDKCRIGYINMNSERYEYEIGIGTLLKNERFEIETEVINAENIKKYSKDVFVKCFDYDKISYALKIRNRKNGDRIKVLGMQGSKKLKDLFIDLKIPRYERNDIPLIVSGDQIVWVVGYRISDDFKVTDSTRRVLKIKILKRGEKKLDDE